jgi:hypothetical protein
MRGQKPEALARVPGPRLEVRLTPKSGGPNAPRFHALTKKEPTPKFPNCAPTDW